MRETERLEVEAEPVEPESAAVDTSFQDCNNCKILKTIIVQLQKKISWLNKSKATLSKKLKTTAKGDFIRKVKNYC